MNERKSRKWYTVLQVMVCFAITIVVTAFLGKEALAEGGTGTSDDPIEISTAEDLKSFATRVNSGNGDLCAKLTKNIVLNDETFTFDPDTGLVKVTDGMNIAYIGTDIYGDKSGANDTFDEEASAMGQWYGSDTSREMGGYSGELVTWMPIGTYGIPFAGTFDGKGYTVSGLYVNGEDSYVGLFGRNNGTVKNVGVAGSCLTGRNFVSGVAGSNDGTVTQCYHMGIVVGYDFIGGIAGGSTDSVSNCYNAGTIFGMYHGGGIVATNHGGISNCCNTGSVIGSCFGDIVVDNDGPISACYYLGEEDDGTDGTTAMTAAQFASGEVTYALNGGDTQVNPLVWYQGDEIPEFSGRVVTKSEGKVFVELANAADLTWFAEQVNGGNTAINAMLTEDICFA